MKLRVALLLFAGLLGACTSPAGKREGVWPYPEPPVVDAPPSPSDPLPGTPAPLPSAEPQPIPPEARPPPPNAPRTAEQISGQAVVSLMRQAREARGQGRFDMAASSLERAQRIEPRNYFVWSMMAQVRLEQQQYEQAVSMAAKSNSLARGNVYVELENWKTISAARAAQGDSLGALQAQSKIEDLQRRIGG